MIMPRWVVNIRTISPGLSHVLTIVAVLALQREGRLDLDAKISTWLGGEPWFARLPNHEDLTLRMLLTHSSGIGDHLHEIASSNRCPAYGHGGTMPGYTSAMSYFPDLKLSIAVQANGGDFDRLSVPLDLIDALQSARCASVPE